VGVTSSPISVYLPGSATCLLTALRPIASAGLQSRRSTSPGLFVVTRARAAGFRHSAAGSPCRPAVAWCHCRDGGLRVLVVSAFSSCDKQQLWLKRERSRDIERHEPAEVQRRFGRRRDGGAVERFDARQRRECEPESHAVLKRSSLIGLGIRCRLWSWRGVGAWGSVRERERRRSGTAPRPRPLGLYTRPFSIRRTSAGSRRESSPWSTPASREHGPSAASGPRRRSGLRAYDSTRAAQCGRRRSCRKHDDDAAAYGIGNAWGERPPVRSAATAITMPLRPHRRRHAVGRSTPPG